MKGNKLTAELAPLDIIRVETALSRYPIHRLSKTGIVDIEIQERGVGGEVTLKWEVSHNSRHGQPGPLAYKVDTLVINRQVEAAGRPSPKVIRLGSLREIAVAVGAGTGNCGMVKAALHQNASAYIEAKIRYRAAGGGHRSMEIGSSRYAVIFTGESLPDGRKADAVHIVLHDFYREILDTAIVRPLDYDYLRDLTPASQRWFELASYQVFAALKNGRDRARLGYSEFCRHAPQTRHPTRDLVRRQMAKVHAPHLASGYITSVEYENVPAADGLPDWMMFYTLGPKATGRPSITEDSTTKILEEPAPPGPVADLIVRGVTPSTAAKLVESYPAERVARQLEAFDFLASRKDKSLKRNPAGYLHRAIADDFAPPPGFVPAVEVERRRVEAEAVRLAEVEAARGRAEAREVEQRIRAHWHGLPAEERARVEAEALAAADPETRAACMTGPPMLRRLAVAAARDAYLRSALGLAGTG